MSLSNLSKVLIATISFFIILAVGVGIWGWQQLDRPYQISQNYSQYQARLNTDARMLLNQYLASGDAQQLQLAETTIAELKAQQFD